MITFILSQMQWNSKIRAKRAFITFNFNHHKYVDINWTFLQHFLKKVKSSSCFLCLLRSKHSREVHHDSVFLPQKAKNEKLQRSNSHTHSFVISSIASSSRCYISAMFFYDSAPLKWPQLLQWLKLSFL